MDGFDLPDHLDFHSGAAGEPSEVPWELILNGFARKQGQAQRKLSKRRPSRRYAEGMGQRWLNTSKLAVLLDVSASVTDVMLDRFMSALDDLLSKGHSVRLFQVDDRIRSVTEYRLGYRPPFRKGQATRFNKAISQILSEYKQDGLLIFTDGMLQEIPMSISIPHIWVLDKPKALPFVLGPHRIYLSNEN